MRRAYMHPEDSVPPPRGVCCAAMTIRLSVAIMHHPSRPGPLRRLRAQLDDQSARYTVVRDPDPRGARNPWRTARLAWSRTPAGATHRLVLQDDAIICDGFVPAVRAALKAKPDVPVSFFVNQIGHQLGQAQREACERCSAWCEFPQYGWYPTVALALPRELAAGLAAMPDLGRPVADDAIVARFLNAERVSCWQTVPSLVDHDDDEPSSVTNNEIRYSRQATLHIGEHHPAVIDWTRDY